MNTNKPVFEKLFRLVNENPLSARQNLDTEEKIPGLLCRMADFQSNPDIFYLITEINEQYCDVIPGSLDGIMAGPEDIVLPKNVLGNYIFLSLNMAATLPLKAIGKGFAMLDDKTYNRIIDSQIKFETDDDGDQASYPFGLPYISQNDSRIAYHEIIMDIVQHAQAPVYSEVFDEESEPVDFAESVKEWFKKSFVPVFHEPELALAAGSARNNPQSECVLDGFDGSVLLEYSLMEKILHIDFFDAKDNPEKQRFENWKIADAMGQILGSVRDGSVLIPMTEFNPRICLVDPDGNIHAFEPVNG
jgi:hypothetical protein